MQFKSATLVLAFAMVRSLTATPISTTETDDLVELYHEDSSSDGSIVYYGTEGGKERRDDGLPDDRPELFRETTQSGGSLVYYGDKIRREEDATTKVSKRCWLWGCNEHCPDVGTPDCDSKRNGAPNELCDKLLAELGDHSEVRIEQSPRQICYLDGKACCVSWGTKLPVELTKGDLYKHADHGK